MEANQSMRRRLLRSLAALPAWFLLRPGGANAQAGNVVVFTGVEVAAGGIHDHVFGWAAATPGGWVGRVVTAHVAVAMRDIPGFAAGKTMVVPRGSHNTINGYTDQDGVRASSVCFASITKGVVAGSTVALTGELTHTEHPVIFKPGASVRVEGRIGADQFTVTVEAAGRNREIRCTGVVLTS